MSESNLEFAADRLIKVQYLSLKKAKLYYDYYQKYMEIGLESFNFDWEKFLKLIEISTLSNIVYLDASVISKNLNSAKLDWEKIHFIKSSYLLTHEAMKTYNEKYGQFLKENIENSDIKSLELFNKLKIQRRDFIKEYKEVKTIRDNIVAHILIDYDFLMLYETIMKFDAEKTALMIIDLMKFFETLILLSSNLIQEMKIADLKIEL